MAAAPDFASTLPTVQEKVLRMDRERADTAMEHAVAAAEAAIVPESDFVHDRPTVAREVDALAAQAQVEMAVEFGREARTVAIKGMAEKPALPADSTPAVEIAESPGVYRMKRPPIVDDITTPLPCRTPSPVEPRVRLGVPKKST